MAEQESIPVVDLSAFGTKATMTHAYGLLELSTRPAMTLALYILQGMVSTLHYYEKHSTGQKDCSVSLTRKRRMRYIRMVLCHIEVCFSLTAIIFVGLNSEVYSHPGLEKVYSKAEVERKDANETDGDLLR